MKKLVLDARFCTIYIYRVINIPSNNGITGDRSTMSHANNNNNHGSGDIDSKLDQDS